MKYAIYGFIVWAAATLGLRFRGEALFRPESALAVLALFASSLLLMPALAWLLLSRLRTPDAEWPRAAILLALPGMLLDAATTYWFALVFPNIPSEAAPLFGSWLLWSYGLLLAAALRRKSGATQS